MTLSVFCKDFNDMDIGYKITQVKAEGLTNRLIDYIELNMLNQIYDYDRKEIREMVISELQ